MGVKSTLMNFLVQLRNRFTSLKENYSFDLSSHLSSRIFFFSFLIYIFLTTILAFIWSDEPSQFEINELIVDYSKGKDRLIQNGSVVSLTLINVADILLHKPGGFISNDLTLPGIYLDNIPSWEFGVLVQVRDLSRAMRESFSRSQSQSSEDKDLAIAEPRFNFDNSSWIFPRSEDEYREGINFIKNYLNRLNQFDSSDATFFSRADNLTFWLATVETRLGSLSQRLSASVGKRSLSEDSGEINIKTPWHQIDNILYEARGSAWALLHFLKAVENDFQDVLNDKNALISLRQIIRELEGTQSKIWSPVILNGSGFGLFANHSLVMASYISRANAGIINLRELLVKG
jgi:hypothetical protein